MRIFDKAIERVRRELRGGAIPERLRDAADRLATLIDPKRPQEHAREPHRVTTNKVVALEDALGATAAGAATSALLPDDHGPHVRDQPAGVCPFTGMRADGTPAVASTDVVSAKDPTLELTMPLAVPPGEDSQASAPVRAPKKARQKNKEKLARADVVENTSARSASRPAKKQPRSRTQATRKKA